MWPTVAILARKLVKAIPVASIERLDHFLPQFFYVLKRLASSKQDSQLLAFLSVGASYLRSRKWPDRRYLDTDGPHDEH